MLQRQGARCGCCGEFVTCTGLCCAGGQPLLGTLRLSTPVSCSSHGTSGRTPSLCSPVLPSFSWGSFSNGCDRTRRGLIAGFLPRQARGGSDSVAVETEAVNVAMTPRSEHPSPESGHRLTYQRDRLLPIGRASRVYRSLLYAVLVFISFFLMLVFMTYNVRDYVHVNYGFRLLTTASGISDPGDRRRSCCWTLSVFRVWFGRRGKGDGLSLRSSVALTPQFIAGPHKRRLFPWSLCCPVCLSVFFSRIYLLFSLEICWSGTQRRIT